MKNRLLWMVTACCGWLLAGSCETSDPGVRVEEVNGEKLYVCEVNKVKDSLTLPLSELVESLHVVKLDTARAALIKGGVVVMSDNYIGIKPWEKQSFKLFDKQGKYLRDIGAIGKGPGEYLTLACSQIDEANNRIYLLPWQTGQLLRYDLEGNMLPSVKLACDFIPKGRFSVKDGRLTVFTLPFKGSVKYLAFQQDLDTTVYSKIPAEPYAIPFDYSNEVFSSGNGDLPDVYVFQFFNSAQDSLFHYDAANNRMIPRLTADFGTGKTPMHSFGELPHYFYVETAEQKQIGQYSFTGDNYKYI
ncbi:MAG: 6-bladed beta-propeller, partial [Odoribacter sp.]|nr:6-bladed beta-propeller [Odoribacter sp.]